jgi:hypothetical protein
MKSFTKQPFTQKPTEADGIHDCTPPMESMGNHSASKHAAINEWMNHMQSNHSADDEGMMGSFVNNKVTLHNAHPHTEHSVGYHVTSPRHEHGLNHGIQSMHIVHHKRDKNPEHHPPKGLYDQGAVDHGNFTQSVF